MTTKQQGYNASVTTESQTWRSFITCPLPWSHYRAIADVLAGTSARLWISATWRGNLIFFPANLVPLHCSTQRSLFCFLWELLSSEAGPSEQIPDNLLFCAVMIKCTAGLHYFPSPRWHGEVRSDKNTGQSCSAGVLTSRTTITIMSSCVRRAFWSNVHSKHFRFEEELIMVPERIYSYSHFHRSLLNFFQVL